MKNAILLILTVCLAGAMAGCRLISEDDLFPVPSVVDNTELKMSYFNQVYTRFRLDEINCLLDQSRAGTYLEERPVVFRVVNDDSTYRSFFGCKPEVKLPSIDFSTKTLLIGINAGSGPGNEAPVNISRMEQRMTRDPNDDLVLNVTITGQKLPGSGGGEWFGFTSLIPKTRRQVTLEMNYVYEERE